MSGTVGSKIVKGGLVFYMDAANPNCYISGNTTCNDLTSSISGSLENGVGFSMGQILTYLVVIWKWMVGQN